MRKSDFAKKRALSTASAKPSRLAPKLGEPGGEQLMHRSYPAVKSILTPRTTVALPHHNVLLD